jgi:hypothetical protein
MYRVGVHGHQGEPGIVELGNRPPRPMLENLARAEIFKIARHANFLSRVRSAIRPTPYGTLD